MDALSGDKSNAEHDLYVPLTDSFWEIGKYSRAVKRCDDGNKLTTDLISMIGERAELEKTFSKMLKSWSKKWSDYVAKSSEFGSMTSAWKAVMSEADATAEVHQAVHDDLQNDVIPSIKTWQKGKYIKSMMHVKSTKEFDEDFKRAQKPWAKLYTKVDKYKREYHVATKGLKTAETQENNAKLDGSIPQEQRSKAVERVERCRKDKDSAKIKYSEALQDLNRANPKYMDDMNDVFIRCQAFEKDRLVKFQEFLSHTEKCLDITSRLRSPIFQQFSHTIENCDPDKDLTWWSDTYGATMKMNWPVFEESTKLDHYHHHHHHHQQQQQLQHNYFSYSGDLSLGYETYYRRPLVEIVSETNAAVVVGDSYATLRRSMRRTAAVVTRMRRGFVKREEYSESHRTLGRRGKGEMERENPVVVTAIRSNSNGPPSYPSSTDNRLSTFPVNQSPVQNARSTVYPTLDTSTASNANPFDEDDEDNDAPLKEKSTNNGSNNSGYPSLPPYSTHDVHSPPYPAAANPFVDDDDNVDSSSSSHHRSFQSPASAGGSSLDNSAGVPVRALYDYEAQEQDELTFKQGDVFTKLEDEDDQGWCRGRVGNRTGLYPATYVEIL
ncbi:unnamed protein product [Rotaria socialis]|uniref:Protein kinase C and casein kinase substrate in neurons protein 1 n=1 Tax=Rotaria socialis TaxID=392032 RepID=A0A818K7X8_9BILA|nr:unnamed protein product [Rotaria socialis]CAF4622148.1 unnamed protein product [Rotaria socialis]